jgi:hypothetical protein
MNCLLHESQRRCSRASEVESLESRLCYRLGRSIRAFQILHHEGGLVLKGYSQTYYAKQLAQHAVMQATEMPILANEIEVHGILAPVPE